MGEHEEAIRDALESVRVRFHRDGFVTMADDPSRVVGTWGKLPDGSFNVEAHRLLPMPRTYHRHAVNTFPRHLANRLVKDWVAKSRAHEARTTPDTKGGR